MGILSRKPVLAAVIALLAALLGPHLLILLAFTLAVLAVGVLCFGIASVLTETSWSVHPRGRARSW
jgi:disulfide bond formation protein DsbB